MATKKVLACSYSRSLQLLYTVSGNQSRFAARTEFKILEPSPKGGWKLVVNTTVFTPELLYIIVAYTYSIIDILDISLLILIYRLSFL